MTAWKRGTLRRQCPYDLQEDWAGDRAHVLGALPQDTPAPAIFTDGHSLVFKGRLVKLPVPGQKSSSSVSADDTVSSGVVPVPARLSQQSELPQPQQQGCSQPRCGPPRPSSGPVPSQGSGPLTPSAAAGQGPLLPGLPSQPGLRRPNGCRQCGEHRLRRRQAASAQPAGLGVWLLGPRLAQGPAPQG